MCIFSLCISVVYAQEQKERTIDDYERIFYGRLDERMRQLDDYMHYLIKDKAQTAHAEYAQKMLKLFAERSLVIVNYASEERKADTLSLKCFVDTLRCSQNRVLHIDSIDIPVWDPLLIQDSMNVVIAESRMVPFQYKRNAFSIADLTELPIVKENTEDGCEWAPLFGNIVVISRPSAKQEQKQNTTEDLLINQNKRLYDARVKFIDEFMERFNGLNYRADLDSIKVNKRQKNLLLLFDGEQFSSFEDERFKEAEVFVEKVVDDSIVINFSDTVWLAKATCYGTLKDKPIKFVMYLNVEHEKADIYKWVIAKVEGDCFSLVSKGRKKGMLLPDEHEINFMSLHNVTVNQREDILDFSQCTFKVDDTSVFFAYVKAGLLKIDYVKPLEFVFLQVPDYKFEVKYFEREAANAGWLISSISRMPDKEKKAFLNYVYNKGRCENEE